MSFEKFKEYHNANYHDGDSTFDERNYRKSNGDDFDNCFVQDCYDHFEAGAQSRQAEIDELNKVIDEALKHVVDHGGYDDLTHVINILKGNKND